MHTPELSNQSIVRLPWLQHRLGRRQTTGGDEAKAELRKEFIVFPSVNSTNGSKIYPVFSFRS
jgi:hypothetical protein